MLVRDGVDHTLAVQGRNDQCVPKRLRAKGADIELRWVARQRSAALGQLDDPLDQFFHLCRKLVAVSGTMLLEVDERFEQLGAGHRVES